MRCADRVNAHTAQDIQLSPRCFFMKSSTKGSKVVVHTHATELYTFSVQLKAVVGREFGCPETKARFHRVFCFSVHNQL
jgi:hypothetical protein